MTRTVRLFTFFALVGLVAGTVNLSAARGRHDLRLKSCPPCKRSVCQQICGPQKPAFCDIDPITGCPVCACNG